MSRLDVPRRVLTIYQNHIAEQEAEIQRLESRIAEYSSKFGELDLSSSAEFQKAKLERELQELRKKNNEYQLKIQTITGSLNQRQSTVKDMEEAVKELTKKISGGKEDTFKAIEERVQSLENGNEKLDKQLAELQIEMQKILQEKI